MDEVGCRAEKISLPERHGFQSSGSNFWFWFFRISTKTEDDLMVNTTESQIRLTEEMVVYIETVIAFIR